MDATPQLVGDVVSPWAPPGRPPKAGMSGIHCRLEPLNPETHAAALFQANSFDHSGRMWTYLPYGPFANLSDYQGWTDRMSCRDDPLFYAIIDLETNQPLGTAAFLRIDPTNGVIEIGHLAFSPALRQTTIATEAFFLLIERAFGLGYRRCEWKCDSLNAASRAAALRLGFKFEGMFRQAAVVKGRNRDTAWYAMIDKDWPRLRAAFGQWLAPENFDVEGRQILSLTTLING